MPELKVATNIYTGPLDLLLYLVRRSEVDIHNLPVGEIADQYIAELQKMERVDLEFAGEYLVMAAQLLKVKSEMVLERAERAGKQDPRQSLVEQLLEYKRLRDLAVTMGKYQEDAARRHGRPSGLVPDATPDDIYLDEVNAYDLYRQHARLMREVSTTHAHRVVFDERPIEEYIKLILAKLIRGERVDFATLLDEKPRKQTVIGNFLAILEMVKQGKVTVEQDDAGIHVLAAQATS